MASRRRKRRERRYRALLRQFRFVTLYRHRGSGFALTTDESVAEAAGYTHPYRRAAGVTEYELVLRGAAVRAAARVMRERGWAPERATDALALMGGGRR
jgi:hypothetical protein